MLTALLFVIIGLALLMFGADRFVDGAAALASNLGVPPLLVGLTVVGFATSAPELLVAAAASFAGNPSIAIGNAIGSNIANIGLVIGVTALVSPLAVHSGVLRQEFPIMFVSMLLALFLFWDGELSRFDGVVLALGLFTMMGVTTFVGMKYSRRPQSKLPDEESLEQTEFVSLSTPKALLLSLIGLICLVIGSDRLVAGAVFIASHFGVSDLVIGLTIVAVGTSLPELAASVASALKGESDIALGNVIGSNMFNILGVTATPALISPSLLEPDVMLRDMPIMFGLTIALYIMAFGRAGAVGRVGGGCLLVAFAAYQLTLYTSAVS
ncbi:MAG: calcium/sodium antiporter [Gammaproteobacteria bacterium]